MLKRKLFATLMAVSSINCIVDAQEPVLSQPSAIVAKKLDSTRSGVGVRASKLIGMTIHNSQKENIGQIKDVVLDPLSTRIQYVAVSYGGFLGLGNKLFAVPMLAIKVQANSDHKDQVILIMDVSKEQMNGATGFDEEHWPDFADTNFVTDLHQRYGVTKASSEMNLAIRERGQAMKGFVQDIESLTVKNKDFRQVLYTAKNCQLVLMSLKPGEDIGEEIHHLDQFFRVEEGTGNAVINGIPTVIRAGFAFIVPAGAKHNIVNTGNDALKLYTIYSPPNHRDGVVHRTRTEANAASEHFDGKTTEE